MGTNVLFIRHIYLPVNNFSEGICLSNFMLIIYQVINTMKSITTLVLLSVLIKIGE